MKRAREAYIHSFYFFIILQYKLIKSLNLLIIINKRLTFTFMDLLFHGISYNECKVRIKGV